MKRLKGNSGLEGALDTVRFGERNILNLRESLPSPSDAAMRAEQWLRQKQVEGVAEVLVVTIPVIVRLGNLEATAAISNVELEKKDGKPLISLDLSRKGARSTFGEVRVLKPGVKDPIALLKGVAVYTEIG